MSSPLDRVQILLKRAKIPDARRASEIYGLGYEAVKKLLSGERELNDNQARKIADHHRVSAGWLLFGEGTPDGAGTVQLIGSIGAGQQVFPFPEDSSHRTIEADFGGTEAYAFEVDGESMLPLARPRDIVFFGPERRDLDNLIGEECIVTLQDDRRFFKVLERGSAAGVFDLVSYNAEPLRGQKVHSAGLFLGVRRRGQARSRRR
jgi:phage repressor protein C with HTH and peptisase S24 domain